MEQGVRAYMQQSRIFVGMVLILIFGEVLGLYGYVTSRETCAVQTTHTFQSHRGAYSEHQEQGLIWLILTCNIRKWRQADMESNHASCKNQWPLYILCPIPRLLLLLFGWPVGIIASLVASSRKTWGFRGRADLSNDTPTPTAHIP